MPKKTSGKTALRKVVYGDSEGSIDHDFLDDAGMKKAQIRNAKKGLIIIFYDENNEPTQHFLSAEAICSFAKDMAQLA